ncbi:acyl-CoA dehydrogenase family protein [Nocardioides jishulii]|uniref:Acyl-CoA dehydrogenase n=1 Tax=Nocardioides jishulii TaxID=2575440 RepID=A0A4U2YPF5_9ACTN|nr:acyl-CoA dehydrogenase family protein [Nocardioides jishulii]QCX27928.1 acyl-CoA dehydrogenase [Nocardioides jishulii]TKI62734.1 acyl-CoA dehydrogenase [Nocardioides jishulii]
MLTTQPSREPAERSALRTVVRGILDRHLPGPEALETDRRGTFSRVTWEALGQAGLLGIGADEALGGSGGTVGDAVAVTEEVARRLPSLAVDHVLTGMAMRMLTSPDCGATSSLLPRVATGEAIASYGLSEPGAGTDLLALRTRAELRDGQWHLHGQKTWISLAHEAEVVFVLARTDPATDGRRARGLSLIAVPTDQPGVQVTRVHLAGMRAAGTCEVFLDDAVAPAENLVGERGKGLRILSQALDVERVMAAAISLGIGRAALDLALSYAHEREAFGAPIGALQAVQHPLADSMAEFHAARALVDLSVRRIEEGEDAIAHAGMAKLVASETTARIVDRSMRAMGAMGLAEESAMQMYFRDARLQLFSPISNEMIRNLVAEDAGLPRSY